MAMQANCAAIVDANAKPGSTISFASGLTGVIKLTSGLPTITVSMTIKGPGASLLAIDGMGKYRPFFITPSGTDKVSVSGLTIEAGSDAVDYGGGGGVVSGGTVSFTECSFVGNAAGNGGGGIECAGITTLTDCTFTDNHDNSDTGGGAINNVGTLVVTDCSFTSNTSNFDFGDDGGGAIWNIGIATVTDCSLFDNTSGEGGAIVEAGTFDVNSLTISGCTFYGNRSNEGGAISGAASLVNCTLIGNSSTQSGGAISAGSTLTLTNCTISGNSAAEGGAIDTFNGKTMNLTNCILYGNSAPSSPEIEGGYSGAVNTAEYCDIEGGWTGEGDIDVNPVLGPLSENGGPTETMALGATSPCYGAGLHSAAPPTDQRGATRPNPPSMGAYDGVRPTSLSSVSLNEASVTSGTAVACTVKLSEPAAATGFSVSLASSSAAAVVPSSIDIASGKTSLEFSVPTYSVTSAQTVTIKAYAAGVSKTATLVVKPAADSLSIVPNSVVGGKASDAVVRVAKAVTAETVVDVSSTSSLVTLPASVDIAKGAAAVSFPIATKAVSVPTLAVLKITIGSLSQSATLMLEPAPISSFTLSPNSVVGGHGTDGIIKLAGNAGPAGNVVKVSSTNADVVVPATVTIPAGWTAVSFAIQTKAVTVKSTVTITLSFNGVATSQLLTVSP